MSEGTITLSIASSVDGFIATEDGGVSWLEDFESGSEDDDGDGDAGNEDVGDGDAGSYEEFFADVDALVVGSKTYEQVLGFGEWPYGRKPTYVVTRRDLPRATDEVELFGGDPGALARRLERQYDHTWLVGGAQLAQEFLALGRVDQIRLSVVPVLLGSGIPLFDDDGETWGLTLQDVTSFENGIVELQYHVEA